MKRGKAGKKGKLKTKRKGSFSSEDEQVSVSTSLPPAVEGQLRCFLSMSVSRFTWAADNHPKDVLVRICWWGEQGQGTLIRPLIAGQKGVDASTKWTPLRYPVCSGPKQFVAYLNDMGSLLLEAVHASTHIPFGKALVSEITNLSASQPVNVVVPVTSVISPFNKLADIQVFIKFESVNAAYNKLSSTIPTVDTGLDKENVDISNPQPTPPPYLNPATPVSHPRHHVKDPFDSPAPLKGVKFSGEPPQRLEYTLESSLLSLVDTDYTEISDKASTHHQGDVGTLDHKGSVQDTIPKQDAGPAQERVSNIEHEMPANSQSIDADSTDWIGALLERGQRLREGLAMSTLLDNNTAGSFLEQRGSPDRHVLPGRLFKEILSRDSKPGHTTHHSQVFDHSPEQALTNEDKVIDLLMGDQLDVEFTENMSMSDVSEDLSEIGDPLHDESLLMDLFYKSQLEKSAESDHDTTISTDEELDSTLTNDSVEEDKRKHKKKKNKNKKPKLRQIIAEEDKTESPSQSLEISGHSEVISSSSIEEPPSKPLSSLVEQLGADMLTTLGRVNTARVIIDKLEFNDGCSVGKPCDGKKPSTFFVEYYFPISPTKDTVKNATMATEVTRVASKKTHDKGILFNHRSVFPVLFNATVLEQWCNAGMMFMIFKRESGQRQPTELGAGVFPLRAVLSSSTLSHTHLIEVKDQVITKQHGVDSSSSTPTSLAYQPSDSDCTTKPCRTGAIGKLEVTVELGVDGKEVHVKPHSMSASTTKATIPLDQGTTSVSMVSRPVVISCSQSQHPPQPSLHKDGEDVLTAKPPLPRTFNGPHSSVKEPIDEPADLITLHSLLWIPEGKGVTAEPHGSQGNQFTVPGIGGRTNLFMVSRMFWCEEVSKSSICWGTSNPQFGFKQVAPVLLTATLLQRTCNNYMVIEVWHKVIPHGEQLIGIVKLPLHQLYLSYRDPKITKTLVQSKFPVICVDEVLSICNPFTGTVHGELKVLLAMGTEEQISSLLAIKGGSDGIGRSSDDVPSGQHSRPSHHLDQPSKESRSSNSGPSPKKSFAIDHQFEVTVGDVRGLSVFKSTVWGETDCYVKYHFPHQHHTTEDFDTEVVPGLKSHHTPTTLCIPDPSFQDITRHSFVLPPGVPVQRYLLAAYSGSWTSASSVPGSGGVPFELWRRYYYPNVRDQLVAKASLPVAKLCAMVTMQRHREPSVQTFSLPLVVLPDDQGTKHDSGLLEITVKYHGKRVVPDEKVETRHGEDQVSLSVDIIRACALKDSAMAHSHTNPNMSYPADVGINCYVVIKLPIGRKTKYITRTVARSFAPDFSHHLDIMAPLQVNRKSHDTDDDRGGELVSLAERLEMSEAVFEVWHQYSRGIGNIESNSDGTQRTKCRKKDVLMGVVSIPMSELLTKRTGIRGWHAIKPVDKNLIEGCDTKSADITLGGLQLSIKFEDPEDREAVVHAGRSLGWSPPPGVEYDDDVDVLRSGDDDDDEGHSPKGLELSLKMSRVWVPVSLVQDHQGPSRQSKELNGYVRYKLYDKSPLCSRVVPVRQKDHKMCILEVKHGKSFIVPATASLVWYLREESLEVQVWLRGQTRKGKDGGDGHVLPGQRDKLVGSAFIDLSSLVVPGLQHSQISGVFPLFKAGVDAMDGASIHVQISLAKPNAYSHRQDQQDVLDDTLSSDDYPSTRHLADHDSTSFKSTSDSHPSEGKDTNYLPQTPPGSTTTTDDDKDSFAAHVIVQEAHHLPTVMKDNGERVPPNAYVTYQTSASSSVISIPVIKSSTKPVWEYQKLERLSLATLKTQNLVFKVWHRPDNQDGNLTKLPSKKKKDGKSGSTSGDYGLGFASVDLAPLAAGLRQLIGWYNIMDFNGECKGQIKVGVVPLAPVSPSRCLPRTRLNISPPLSRINQHLPMFMSSGEQTSLGNASELTSNQTRLFQPEGFSQPKFDDKQHAVSEDTLEFNHRENMVTQPSSTSTSFLFRQLRQNMQDLDNLQRGLQAKLNLKSSGRTDGSHHAKEIPHPAVSTGNVNLLSSHYSASRQDTHEIMLDNHNKGLATGRDTEYTDSAWNDPENEFQSHATKSGETNVIDRKDLAETANEFDPETMRDIGNAVSDHLSDSFLRDSPPSRTDVLASNACNTDLRSTDQRVKDTDRHVNLETEERMPYQEEQLQEYQQSEENSDIDSVGKAQSPESLDHSDSLEEVSSYDKTETESPFKFTQEVDSWLSSGDDEETKSPLTAQAFLISDNGPDPSVLKHASRKSDNTNDYSETNLKASTDTVTLNSREDDIIQAMDVFSAGQPQKDHDSNEEVPDVVKEGFLQHEPLSNDEPTFDANSSCDSKNADYHEDNVIMSMNENIETETKANTVSLPNFFMPTQQLENSMRALRLGAKLGYPNSLNDNYPKSKLLERTFRNQDVEESKGETEGILSQFSRKKVLYKAKQDMQPPLSSIEIDRIARIFSSKEK